MIVCWRQDCQQNNWKVRPLDEKVTDGAATLTQRAEDTSYALLREAIASGTYAPNERLIEMDLASSLGVSRAAIRTALARLAQENIVERLPNRGARVRRASEKEIIEILEARLVLECLAVRQAAANAGADDVERLESILDEMERGIARDDLLAYGETNARFHREIVRIADHETAAKLIENLHSRSAHHQLDVGLQPSNPEGRLQEHRSIARAIKEHDQDGADAAMRRHLSGVIDGLRRRLLR